MVKEKWLLAITDKDNEDVVFNNVFIKPDLLNSDGNARIFMFYGMKEKIDAMYQKLKWIEGAKELSLHVGEMREKDKPGGLNQVLKAAFGDKWEQYTIHRRNNK
jgi:hypothetical protein